MLPMVKVISNTSIREANALNSRTAVQSWMLSQMMLTLNLRILLKFLLIRILHPKS